MARRTGLVAVLCLLALSTPLTAANKKTLPGNPMSDTFVIETSLGTITVQLDPKNAPLHAANFAKYADDGFFDGLVFHRVIPGFMIQGGGMSPEMNQKRPTQNPVRNESLNGQKNLRGTLAAARTPDPDSATSQFFINLKDNGFLNHTGKNPQGWGYTVFGKVIEGMDTVDKIARVKASPGRISEAVPQEAVVIEKATASSPKE